MDRDYLCSLFDLAGQVIAITGGGGVLCGAVAEGLGRLGARVAILDLSAEAAQSVAEEIQQQGGEALAIPTDVLDRASLERGCKEVLARFGTVDALINGAGGNRPAATTNPDVSFFDLPREALEGVLDLNFLGTVLATQVYGRVMAEKGQGNIINIASIAAMRPMTRVLAYSAAKGAVANLTQWLAVHMAEEYSPRIRVNAVAPGFFLTHQNRYLLLDEETGEPTERGRAIVAHTPMRRYGDPQELLGIVLWLLSPAASFVHGATIPIDGGFCAFAGV